MGKGLCAELALFLGVGNVSVGPKPLVYCSNTISVFLIHNVGVITTASLGYCKDEKVTYVSHRCNAWHIVGAAEMVAANAVISFLFSSWPQAWNYVSAVFWGGDYEGWGRIGSGSSCLNGLTQCLVVRPLTLHRSRADLKAMLPPARVWLFIMPSTQWTLVLVKSHTC